MSEATTSETESARIRWIAILEKFGVVLFLIVLMVFFTTQNVRFIYPRNLFNILADVSIYGVMAVGMTLVILTAGIDLSVGAILAFAAMSSAAVLKGTGESRALPEDPMAFGGCAWLIALVVATGVGLVCGWLQGLAITRLRVPPFVVTLGGMTVWRGATLVAGEGSPISGFAPGLRWWGSGSFLFVPVPVWIFAVVTVAGFILLEHTRYGRQVYAVGGNREAARLSGLRVGRILVSVYTIMGFLAGLAGFMETARLDSAEAVAGDGFELRVIASVVIGGTSLFGGLGGVLGTVVGTVLIGVLLNGLVIMNVSPYYQQIIIGVIIVLAVAFDTFAKSRSGTVSTR
jgi:inositol transport system permease protein